MKNKIIIATLLGCLYFPCSAQEIDRAVAKKFKDIPYLLSTPENYTADQIYPTIIFLHGGDRSNTKHHPSKYAKRAEIDFPFIVIAPSCTGGCSWSSVDLEGLFKQASADVSIDPSRVYLTGYSMGGAGTWANLKKIHHLLAAAAPLAPAGGNTSNLCVAKDLPIRVYHGTADYGYKNSQKMVKALNDCGASQVELVPLEGKGHGIWPGIFSDQTFYDWLLSKKK
ncbi:MAG: hypothetical protein ABJF04_06015 [Reichenbachiella sp.]|uniref:carboxylesterase family protein n=1 Tax=Reichenbachiella sp. TaxID=2184521 RepID=UPI003267B549